MSSTYVALVHKTSKSSSTYGVFFPDFPGLVCAGKNVEEALENARVGLFFHMEGLLKAGEVLPKSTKVEEIMKDPENKKAMPCLVHIIPPKGELMRVNISINAALLAAVDHTAGRLGKNRSEFLSDAAMLALA
ncbi:MAG TPA: type II toxin-antitoxin system HicB family antitoxin [Gammaproteobacteria bacterium]|nr:type II toxin-antitoxin system HicB family antitoxin [Gammaproteobacteria bacterium]